MEMKFKTKTKTNLITDITCLKLRAYFHYKSILNKQKTQAKYSKTN